MDETLFESLLFDPLCFFDPLYFICFTRVLSYKIKYVPPFPIKWTNVENQHRDGFTLDVRCRVDVYDGLFIGGDPDTDISSPHQKFVSFSNLSQPLSMDRQELLSIYSILQLVYHRNKNQHQRAKWWKWLAMLKRATSELASAKNEATHAQRRHLANNIIPKCYVYVIPYFNRRPLLISS